MNIKALAEHITEWPRVYKHEHHKLATALLEVMEDAERLADALKSMQMYFSSGNSIPVERATILAESEEVRKLSQALVQHNKLWERLSDNGKKADL